jgi:hypothetical protein
MAFRSTPPSLPPLRFLARARTRERLGLMEGTGSCNVNSAGEADGALGGKAVQFSAFPCADSSRASASTGAPRSKSLQIGLLMWVSKTVRGGSVPRGFESLPLRYNPNHRPRCGIEHERGGRRARLSHRLKPLPTAIECRAPDAGARTCDPLSELPRKPNSLRARGRRGPGRSQRAPVRQRPRAVGHLRELRPQVATRRAVSRPAVTRPLWRACR